MTLATLARLEAHASSSSAPGACPVVAAALLAVVPCPRPGHEHAAGMLVAGVGWSTS